MLSKGYIRNRVISKVNHILIKLWIFRLFFPSEIYISLNSICNARCKMCDIGIRNSKTDFFKMHEGKGDMSEKTFLNLAESIKNKGINVSFKMTEPLLHPNLGKILKICKDNKISASLTTNGLLLSKKAEDIVKFGLRGLQVSINGPKEIHDEVCGINGAYDRIKEGIKRINYYKEKYNSIYPKIKLRMTVFETNQDLLENSIECFKENFKGIHSAIIAHLNFTEDNMKETKVDRLDIKNIFKQIVRIKQKKHSFKVKFFPELSWKEFEEYYKTYNELKGHDKCSSMYKSLAVMSDGEVTPHIRCLNVCFGNINKENIFKIWNKKKYVVFRKNIWKHLPRGCRRCCQVMVK